MGPVGLGGKMGLITSPFILHILAFWTLDALDLDYNVLVFFLNARLFLFLFYEMFKVYLWSFLL